MWFAVDFQVKWFYTNYPGISDIEQTCFCSNILCSNFTGCKMIIFVTVDKFLNFAKKYENMLEPPEGGGL